VAEIDNAAICRAAAIMWQERVKEEKDAARREERAGRYAGVHEHRARLYTMCSRSLLLEAETGIIHCTCHALPRDTCPMRRKVFHGS